MKGLTETSLWKWMSSDILWHSDSSQVATMMFRKSYSFSGNQKHSWILICISVLALCFKLNASKYWMSPWLESSWPLWSWLFWPWCHRQVTVPLYLTTIYFFPSWESSQERNKTTRILKKQVEILMEALTWWRSVSWKLWGNNLLCIHRIFHNLSLSIHYWPFTLLHIPRRRRD